MKKLFVIANKLKSKYGLFAFGQENDDKLTRMFSDLKKTLVGCYNLHINGATAKRPVIQMAADMGDEFSKELIENYKTINDYIDVLTVEEMFDILNEVMASIAKFKSDPEKKTRNILHDSVRIKRDADRNYRERLKQTFEKEISDISYVTEKQLKILRGLGKIDKDIAGGKVDSQRRELSKKQLYDFTFTEAAEKLNLDTLNLLEKILEYPDLKEKLTTIINALTRGKNPSQWYEFKQEVAELIDKLTARTVKNNSEIFEDS